MNIKFYKSCFDLAALATCVKDNSGALRVGDRIQERIEFADNFFAVAQYKYLGSDYLSAFDYEHHEFSISFIREDYLVETIHFEKKFDCKKLGTLANPKLDLNSKMEVIKECRPTTAEKLENMFTKTKLASHEMAMVISKNKKMYESLIPAEPKKTAKK